MYNCEFRKACYLYEKFPSLVITVLVELENYSQRTANEL